MGVRLGLEAVRDGAGGSGVWGCGMGVRSCGEQAWGWELEVGRRAGSCACSPTPPALWHVGQGSVPGKEHIWAVPGPAPTSAPSPHLHPSRLHRWVLGSPGSLRGDPAQGWGAGQRGRLCWGSLGVVRGCAGAGGTVCQSRGMDRTRILLSGHDESCPVASSCPSAPPRRDPKLHRGQLELWVDGEGGEGKGVLLLGGLPHRSPFLPLP